MIHPSGLSDTLAPPVRRVEGATATNERVVPLVQREEIVGRLVVGWEHGPHLRTRDERVLNEVARPLGLAVGWVRQADQLRRATVSVASTREEERRRLRRDLHDGLGPALTGVSLGLHTAARQLERDGPGTALPSHALVGQAATNVDALVVEVKRIVRDLRPTALDALGLVDAIGEFTRTSRVRRLPDNVGSTARLERQYGQLG